MRIFKSRAAAFTLVEVMITAAVVAAAGAGVFEVLRTGLILFGKNTAINLSHVESRYGLLELQQSLNAAVSTPQLTDSTGAVTSGSGPAAGVTFQAYAGGPYCIYVSTSGSIAATATSIPVITGSNFRPLPGQTIHIQALPISISSNSLLEAQLSGVAAYPASTTGAGVAYYTPTLTGSIGETIPLYDPVATSTALHVACFFTTPVTYVVQNGRLVRYTLDPAGSGTMISTVLAYNVTSATPFTTPALNSSPANTFVNVAALTAIDPSSNYQGNRGMANPATPTSSNQGYHGGTTPFSVKLSHFAQLTIKY